MRRGRILDWAAGHLAVGFRKADVAPVAASSQRRALVWYGDSVKYIAAQLVIWVGATALLLVGAEMHNLALVLFSGLLYITVAFVGAWGQVYGDAS